MKVVANLSSHIIKHYTNGVSNNKTLLNDSSVVNKDLFFGSFNISDANLEDGARLIANGFSNGEVAEALGWLRKNSGNVNNLRNLAIERGILVASNDGGYEYRELPKEDFQSGKSEQLNDDKKVPPVTW